MIFKCNSCNTILIVFHDPDDPLCYRCVKEIYNQGYKDGQKE